MFVNSTMDFLSHKVRWVGPPNDDYKSDRDYEVLIQRMTDGRYSVFKSSVHYNESPGYKVYSTREQINNDFKFI